MNSLDQWIEQKEYDNPRRKSIYVTEYGLAKCNCLIVHHCKVVLLPQNLNLPHQRGILVILCYMTLVFSYMFMGQSPTPP